MTTKYRQPKHLSYYWHLDSGSNAGQIQSVRDCVVPFLADRSRCQLLIGNTPTDRRALTFRRANEWCTGTGWAAQGSTRAAECVRLFIWLPLAVATSSLVRRMRWLIHRSITARPTASDHVPQTINARFQLNLPLNPCITARCAGRPPAAYLLHFLQNSRGKRTSKGQSYCYTNTGKYLNTQIYCGVWRSAVICQHQHAQVA